MSDEIITYRSWLPLSLAIQRNNLAAILLRLKGIGLRAGTRIGLHHKFTCLLADIAVEHEKELYLLNEIDRVEKLHQYRRSHRLLRHPESNRPPQKRMAPEAEKSPVRSDRLTVMAFWALFSMLRIKHKNQDLTSY
jgi:hypothetical protein